MVTFSLTGLCALLAIPVLVLLYLEALPETFYWGIAIGILFGFGTWLALSLIWDPVHMSFRESKRGKERKWLLPVILAGLVIGRTILELFSSELGFLIASSIIFWLIWTGILMVLQAWWHYLRR